MEVAILNQQNIFDIALQHAGTVESFMEILKENDLISLDISSRTVLRIPNVANKRMVAYYAQQGITPATDILETI